MSPLYETAKTRTKDRKAARKASPKPDLVHLINEALEPAIDRCVKAWDNKQCDGLVFLSDMRELDRAACSFISAEARFFKTCRRVSEGWVWDEDANAGEPREPLAAIDDIEL